MVKRRKRNKGIGTMLAKYLMHEIYPNKNILLQPDQDGYWFWRKFGFQSDNISRNETWIINRRKKELIN